MTTEPVELIAAAVRHVREIPDLTERFAAAAELEQQLAEARTLAVDIKSDVIAEMRDTGEGYQRIANRLSLTKSRVQQLAKRSAAGS